MFEWDGDRWNLDGRGVHAGDGLELRFPDGTWLPVRIESADCGRKLYAYFEFHGMDLCLGIFDHEGYTRHDVRWPSGDGHRRYQPSSELVG